MFTRQGSSSDLFKYFEEKGATKEPITSCGWYCCALHIDNDLKQGINKAKLAVRLNNFYGYGLKDANVDPWMQKKLLLIACELAEYELMTLRKWLFKLDKTRQKKSLFNEVAKFI